MGNRNTMTFDKVVKGRYGRRIAYTDVEKITEQNVVQVVGNCYGVFLSNKRAIEYLYNYYKGDQPVYYRTKTIREDVNNKVCENHAYEIVEFKVGQSYGEPIQIVSLKNDEKTNKAVDLFNSYTRAVSKPARDIDVGRWQSATGSGYKGVQKTGKKDLPFKCACLSPLNTFCIYQRGTNEQLAGVQELKDEEGRQYLLVFSDTHEFRIQNSKLMPMYNDSGMVVTSRLHGFGGIPIVEYPNNSDRLSDIEIVISMLDAINNMQSNRMDGIEQFVQSWIKFINCEIDPEAFQQMKMQGALAVKSNGDNKKVDVEVMSQELNQSESQVAKDDIWENVQGILAIPNRDGSTGGDSQGAVELRAGWDFSKQRARLKDPFIIESERKVVSIALNIIRVLGNDDCKLNPLDYDVQINHSPTDNMQVKVQSLNLLLSSGINPLIAIKTVGLFEDAEKVFMLSKNYLDVLYKTVDSIEDAAEQEQKAKEILDTMNKDKNDGNKNEK